MYDEYKTVKGKGYGKKLPLAPKGFLENIWFKVKKFIFWVLGELKDLKNLIIFVIVFLVMSSEVWLCYLLGWIFRAPALIHVANICWLFWLGPATPFIPLCLGVTFAVRKLFDKISAHRKRKKINRKQ